MKKNKNRSTPVLPGTKSGRCPYCGSPIIFRSADGIYKNSGSGTMLYVCARYPACDSYVRALPGSKTPVGSLANGPLRALRREAHECFDELHLTGIMSRSESYEWLACVLQAPLSEAHIGNFGKYFCRRVIEESKQLLENRRKVHGDYPQQKKPQGSDNCATG